MAGGDGEEQQGKAREEARDRHAEEFLHFRIRINPVLGRERYKRVNMEK